MYHRGKNKRREDCGKKRKTEKRKKREKREKKPIRVPISPSCMDACMDGISSRPSLQSVLTPGQDNQDTCAFMPVS